VLVVQASLDDVHAVVGTGLLRIALAGPAVLHLGQGPSAVGIQSDLGISEKKMI